MAESLGPHFEETLHKTPPAAGAGQ